MSISFSRQIRFSFKIFIQITFIFQECPFIIKNEMIDQRVLNNSNVFIECEILCTLTYPYSFSWKKNNQPIDLDTNGKRKYEFTVVEDTYQLKINNFCASDDGIYEIYVSEPDDFHFSTQAKIEVDPNISKNLNTIYMIDTVIF